MSKEFKDIKKMKLNSKNVKPCDIVLTSTNHSTKKDLTLVWKELAGKCREAEAICNENNLLLTASLFNHLAKDMEEPIEIDSVKKVL